MSYAQELDIGLFIYILVNTMGLFGTLADALGTPAWLIFCIIVSSTGRISM